MNKEIRLLSSILSDRVSRWILVIICTAFLEDGMAQCKDWIWPADKKIAEEEIALLQDAIGLKRYKQAIKPLRWLLKEAPEINYSVYVYGATAYDALALRESDPVRKKVLTDSLMIIYDLRISHCGDEPNVLWRKAFSAYKHLINGKEAARVLPVMDSVFYKWLGHAGDDWLIPYIQTLVINHQKFRQPDEDGLLSRYERLVQETEARIAEADKKKEVKRRAKLVRIRKEEDEWLFKAVVPDCNFVRQNLAPRFEKNPKDLALAKRIFAYMLQGKCADDPLWLKAAEAIFEHEKDFGLAKNIALRHLAQDDLNQASQFLNSAIPLAAHRQDSAEIYYYHGVIEARKENKPAARSYFLRVLKLDGARKDACERIGDLYYSSMDDCAEKKSQAIDRAVYLAAYQWYAKAGNDRKMALARQSFPSMEELFLFNFNRGDILHVSCWIDEDVVLQTRD